MQSIFRIFITIITFSFKVIHDSVPFFRLLSFHTLCSLQLHWNGRATNMPQFHASLIVCWALIIFIEPKNTPFLLFDLFKEYLLIWRVFLVGPLAVITGVRCFFSVPKALGTNVDIICVYVWYPYKSFISKAPAWLSKRFYLSPNSR